MKDLFEGKTKWQEVRYEDSDVRGWVKKKRVDHDDHDHGVVTMITGTIEVCSSERFIDGIKHCDVSDDNNCGGYDHADSHFDRSGNNNVSGNGRSSSSSSSVSKGAYTLCCAIQDIVGE